MIDINISKDARMIIIRNAQESLSRYHLVEKKKRLDNNLPLAGEVCEYCRTPDSRNDKETCSRCGAPMKMPFGLCYGIPVYDKNIFIELRNSALIIGANV